MTSQTLGSSRTLAVLIICLTLAPLLEIHADSTFHPKSKEKALIKMLLDRYAKHGREGRPVTNTSESIKVHFGLSLIQMLDVDEKNQILKINIWYNYNWHDALLTWDPKEWDNLTDIRIPSDKIWNPDIVLYNFADDRLKEQRETLAVVQHTGELLWMPQAIIRSSCLLDTLYFPFDEQTCKLKFGSWTYNGYKLDIHNLPNTSMMMMDDYIPNNEWIIIENKAVRNVEKYLCCPEPYPDITFTLKIKRKVAFYFFILILPCTLLSLLTLVIFWVPPESPAKLILGMNIFLAFFVLLLLLADSTPKAVGSIPLIGAYFCMNMVLITMSTVLSCVVANMFFRGVRINRAPKWLRTFMIDVVARAICLRSKVVDPDCNPSTPKKSWNTGRVVGENKAQYPYRNINFAQVRLLDNGVDGKGNPQMADLGECGEEFTGGNSTGGRPRPNDMTSYMAGLVLEEVRSIRDMMDKVREKRAKADEKERYVREWKVIACVMDRIIFMCYLLINFIGILVTFHGQIKRALSPESGTNPYPPEISGN